MAVWEGSQEQESWEDSKHLTVNRNLR